ncbi:sqv-3 [Symbiodinium natans]|uniref:Sqv-3 protein n=1 Tax=Symbiodinium natans TaxID=878477 RepID=A0A812T5U4_9DINO|nr:sqv-3 [Symbiodinium natans]
MFYHNLLAPRYATLQNMASLRHSNAASLMAELHAPQIMFVALFHFGTWSLPKSAANEPFCQCHSTKCMQPTCILVPLAECHPKQHMACELHHSPGRLKLWEQRTKRRAARTAPERVQGAAVQLELAVARREAEAAELRVEVQRAKAALDDVRVLEDEEAAAQEAAQITLARDLQESLHGEKELLERLDAEEEEAKTNAALCDRADSQEHVAVSELRELCQRLETLQESLVREEAVVAALKSELAAGQDHAMGLALEAAEASRKKQNSQQVREPLIRYYAGRAYQDWEEKRADGLRRRLVLKRCFQGFQGCCAATQGLCEQAVNVQQQRASRLTKRILDCWQYAKEDRQAEERLLTQMLRAWADSCDFRVGPRLVSGNMGAMERRLCSLRRQRLAAGVLHAWFRLVPTQPQTGCVSQLGWPDMRFLVRCKDRERCVGAFRGWSFLTWVRARQDALAKGFCKHRRAVTAANALAQLRASVIQRHCWHRCAPLLWRLLATRLASWRRSPQPFVFCAWRSLLRLRKRSRSMAGERLSRWCEQQSRDWRREVWKCWNAAVAAHAALIAASKPKARQRLCFLWLLKSTRLSVSRRFVADIRSRQLKLHLRHWRRSAAQARRLRWQSRLARRNLLQVIFLSWGSQRRRRKAPHAAATVGRAHRRTSLQRTIHSWLLAYGRRKLQVMRCNRLVINAQHKLDNGSAPLRSPEEAQLIPAGLVAARVAETSLAQEEEAMLIETISLRKAVALAAHEMHLAGHGVEQAQMELEAHTKALEESECGKVEQQLCEVLRLNVELARGFRESEACVTAAAARLHALHRCRHVPTGL